LLRLMHTKRNKSMKTLKQIFLVSLLSGLNLVILFAFSSCSINDAKAVKGNGNVTTVSYNVTDFRQLDLSGMYSVTLAKGDTPSLVVETDENLQKLILNKVEDNVLKVYSEKEVFYRPTRMHIYITYRDLERLNTSGACEVKSQDTIVGQDFQLDLNGASTINLSLEVYEMKTNVSGASTLTLSGSVKEHSISFSGAGTLDAENLVAEVTRIKLSGAGSATVNALKLLDADLSGIGSISYIGEPLSKIVKNSGLGSINKEE